MQYKNYYILSAAYGESTYNSSTYADQPGSSTGPSTPVTGGATTPGTTQLSTGNTGSGTTGGTLANTGFDLLVVGTLACAIIFVTLMVRFGKRKSTETLN